MYPELLTGYRFEGGTTQEARDFMWNFFLEKGDVWVVSEAFDRYFDNKAFLLGLMNGAATRGDKPAQHWMETFYASMVENGWYIFSGFGSPYEPRPQCFTAGTPIDMWPLDLGFAPDANGLYNQDAVRAAIWQKPIEEIAVGDIVVSFDGQRNLVPGRGPRLLRNQVKIILNYHVTQVTPGHVYFRADGAKSFETLMDILRDDGVIQSRDGTLRCSSYGDRRCNARCKGCRAWGSVATGSRGD